jgi:hypothetical protein
MLRARHVLVAWLAYGVLQLALLGAGGVVGAPAGVADAESRPQAPWPTVSAGKRLLAPEPTDRRATLTPFAPAAYVRVDVPTRVADATPPERPRSAASKAAVTLPPARAPPSLS